VHLFSHSDGLQVQEVQVCLSIGSGATFGRLVSKGAKLAVSKYVGYLNRIIDISLCIVPMAIELVPIPLPTSADTSKFVDFGREVKGVNPGVLTPGEFKEVQDALYKVLLILRTRCM
jgi:hypothetical protein